MQVHFHASARSWCSDLLKVIFFIKKSFIKKRIRGGRVGRVGMILLKMKTTEN